jgi:hypothetical protein
VFPGTTDYMIWPPHEPPHVYATGTTPAYRYTLHTHSKFAFKRITQREGLYSSTKTGYVCCVLCAVCCVLCDVRCVCVCALSLLLHCYNSQLALRVSYQIVPPDTRQSSP